MLTPQAVYDETIRRIHAQGGPSINPDTRKCKLKYEGRGCAVGVWLTYYDSLMEDLPLFLTDSEIHGRLKAALDSDVTTKKNLRVLGKLRQAHDVAASKGIWKEEFLEQLLIAARHLELDPSRAYAHFRGPTVMTKTSLEVTDEYGAKGATAPRVSLDSMVAKIQQQYFFTAGEALSAISDAHEAAGKGAFPVTQELGLLTICILVMENGFMVIGKSAPASPKNFDADKGKTFAFEDCIRQLWPLEGYNLRTFLYHRDISPADPSSMPAKDPSSSER